MSIKIDTFNNQPEEMRALGRFCTLKKPFQKNKYILLVDSPVQQNQSVEKAAVVAQSLTGSFQKREEIFNTACSSIHQIEGKEDLKSLPRTLWTKSLGRKKKESTISKVASNLSALEQAKQLFAEESNNEKSTFNLSREAAIFGPSCQRNPQKKDRNSACNSVLNSLKNRPKSLWTQTLEKIKKKPKGSQSRSALAQEAQALGKDNERSSYVSCQTAEDSPDNLNNRKSLSGTLKKKAKTFLVNLKSSEEIDVYFEKAKDLFQNAKYTESKKIFKELLGLKQDKKIRKSALLLYLIAIYLLENKGDKASEYLKTNNGSYLNTVMEQHARQLRVEKDKPFLQLDFYEIEKGSEDEKLIADVLFINSIKKFVQFFFQEAEYEKIKNLFDERIKPGQLDKFKKKIPEIYLYLSAICLLEGNGLEANKYLKETENFCLKFLMCEHSTHLLDPKQKGISFPKADVYKIENGSEDEKIIRHKLSKACVSKKR